MRILIHRLGSLGDTIVALPCFHFIRENYPSSHITVLTNTPVNSKAAPLESILENTGLADAFLHYPMGSRDLFGLARLHSGIRREHYDLLISIAFGRHFFSSMRDYIYFRTCGISRIIGLPFSRRDRVCLPRADGSGYEHEAERLLRRAGAEGRVDLRDQRWLDLKLTPEEYHRADQLLVKTGVQGPFLAASLGTKWPSNHWGLENWRELFSQLTASHPTLTMVMLGSADESEPSENILQCWKGPRANLCGQAAPRVSAAILQKARLFIGHDSGPAHLAGAVGTRCVAIYSARNPSGQWFPLGQGHTILYPHSFFKPELGMNLEHQKKAIASISPSAVLSAVEEALAKK